MGRCGEVVNPKDSVGSQKAGTFALPRQVIQECGVAMQEGACKYGSHNYRASKIRASVYIDALDRHVGDWIEGEDIDPDSGLSHITKAITTLMVMRDAMLQGMLVDDRPPAAADTERRPTLNAIAKLVTDRHPDPKQGFTQIDRKLIDVPIDACEKGGTWKPNCHAR